MLLIVFNSSIFAGPGDTTVVQTFQFTGYPVLSGWLAPREGFFDFSATNGKTFTKVLMSYTLKCDAAQSPNCGEWDYLSYAKMLEHTGYGEVPNFYYGGLGGYVVDQISFMNLQSWWYKSRVQDSISYEIPNTVSEYQLGNETIAMPQVFDNSQTDSRSIFLWKSAELTASGLTAGNITGIQFYFNSIAGDYKRLKIRMKTTNLTELTNIVDTNNFKTVYYKDTKLTAMGWQNFDFTNFFNWNGTSNLLIEINFTGTENTQAVNIQGNTQTFNCGVFSNDNDKYLNFNGPDAIYVPITSLSSLQNEVSIAFWQYGNPEVQPAKESIFEAVNAAGQRILNVHLPWENGNVNWDVGNETGYEGIQINLSENQYEGQWNFWTFTKNKTTGFMRIYLNGSLLKAGSGKVKTIGLINKFAIGRGLTDLEPNTMRFYDGSIDEFSIWDKELDLATINQIMYNKIDNSNPNIANLKAYYDFNENDLFNVTDYVTSSVIKMNGIPQKNLYNGDRFKNFSTTLERPNIKFNRNSSNYTLIQKVAVDSFPKQIFQIDKYIQNLPTEKPVYSETVYGYPTYYNNYIYDLNGIATDSTLVPADQTLNLQMLQYPTTVAGEELIIPWELGRFITPYGNNLTLGADGWTWIYDVTDFQHLLVGDEVHLQAGNFQELLDMKFLFIEGTPSRDLIDIKQVWNETLDLKVFDTKVKNETITLNPTAEMFTLKSTVTGHGFGSGNDCGEFCPNQHSLKVNGTQQYNWEILQECGENPLFPQGGTWFYDRAGWCPGMPATVRNFEITPFIQATDQTVDLDYNIQYDDYGNYVMESYLVSYGANNFGLDASIENIIAPNNFKLFGRYNPICGRPIIEIKNNGEQVLNSLTISYGVKGQTVYNYQWTGSLNYLETEQVYLPEIALNDFENTVERTFEVNISLPNNSVDEYEFNNSIKSNFTITPTYYKDFVLNILTNKFPAENYCKIFNAAGDVVYEKTDFQASKVFYDTISLAPGCYEFVMYDTEGDGMYNWPSNSGNGYIKFWNQELTVQHKELEKWFGSYVRHNFILTDVVSIEETKHNIEVNILPNPSNGIFNLNFVSGTFDNYEVKVYDFCGKLLLEKTFDNQNSGSQAIDLTNYKTGMYIINISSDKYKEVKKIIKY